MSKWIPDRKVWAGGLAGALAWFLTLAIQQGTGVILPPEIASGLVGAAGMAVAYLVPPSVADLARRADETLRRLSTP